MVYLGLRPRVSYSAQRPTSAETGRILLLLLLVFPQALPGLEGPHQQTPFGRVPLAEPVLEGANAKVTPVLEGVVGQDACSHRPQRYSWTGCL